MVCLTPWPDQFWRYLAPLTPLSFAVPDRRSACRRALARAAGAGGSDGRGHARGGPLAGMLLVQVIIAAAFLRGLQPVSYFAADGRRASGTAPHLRAGLARARPAPSSTSGGTPPRTTSSRPRCRIWPIFAPAGAPFCRRSRRVPIRPRGISTPCRSRYLVLDELGHAGDLRALRARRSWLASPRPGVWSTPRRARRSARLYGCADERRSRARARARDRLGRVGGHARRARSLFIAHYASNVPSWDDWDMVPTLTRNQPITWEWLWSQHNEHRVPLPRLMFLGLDRLAVSTCGSRCTSTSWSMAALARPR